MAQNQLSASLQNQERFLSKILNERFGEIGKSLQNQTKETTTIMGHLQERLGSITAAQQNIIKLSDQVVSLQDVLANKQARGAFGEIQLADQIRDVLPISAYKFQERLSNGRIVDCLLKLPNPPGSIAIDAKFPLENYHLVRAAKGDNERTKALKSLGADISKHINDIKEKYILHGETADSAVMFVPSEAVYMELLTELPAVVEKSYRDHVYIVSPTNMMAILHTIRAILQNAHMGEQAGKIQSEVKKMVMDVRRLDERAVKLKNHFGQAEKDLEQILISSSKVMKRAQYVEEIDPPEEITHHPMEQSSVKGEEKTVTLPQQNSLKIC